MTIRTCHKCTAPKGIQASVHGINRPNIIVRLIFNAKVCREMESREVECWIYVYNPILPRESKK